MAYIMAYYEAYANCRRRIPVHAMIVSLQVCPGKRAQFLTAIELNAAASVRDEPGCLRFDVMRDTADPDRFYFYEIYTDPAALEAHRAAPHFATWREAASQCVVAGSQVNTVASMIVTHSSDAVA